MIGYLLANTAAIHALQLRGARHTRGGSAASLRLRKMLPRLSDFLPESEIIASKGDTACAVTGIALDSRRVAAGNVFFALPGHRTDGARFIDEALSRGAVAVVAATLPAHPPSRITYLQVADPRETLARASQRFYGFPDRQMAVAGVTGTNGKTTVTYLVRHFLNDGRPVGLIGTIDYDLGARTVPSYRTTPESLDIFGMMAQMRDAGCREVVMEVSSHGIDLKRVLGLRFDAAVFTNLTRDHLDYHSTLEAYFEVKSRLFTGGTGEIPRVSVVNIDDPLGERLAGMARSPKVVTFGENARAMVRAEDVELGFGGSRFRLVWPGGSAEARSPLVGRYNVSNVLAAAAAVWGMGRSPGDFLGKLRSFPGVPGRMERIDAGQDFNVFVDYAHTDDALRNALGMLRSITPGRLLVVFGCGGNRDRAKRPLMVKAVQASADFAFATADNPRREPLAQIFDDMRAGVLAPEKIEWVEDRRSAIALALAAARKDDSVLVAGKGHETYQEFTDTVVPFDDRQVARELLESAGSATSHA